MEEKVCAGKIFEAVQKEAVMQGGIQNDCKRNTGNEKWRRQCSCLRHSWHEVCRRICGLSDRICRHCSK